MPYHGSSSERSAASGLGPEILILTKRTNQEKDSRPDVDQPRSVEHFEGEEEDDEDDDESEPSG
jgi:hypothetical protein